MFESNPSAQKRSDDASKSTESAMECPNCGAPLQAVSRRGPTDATAQPCGCDISAMHVRQLSTDDSDVATDGGVDKTRWTHLTGFKREILKAIARVEASDNNPYGLAIKEELERVYGKEVNHGRLYPNLDDLVRNNLVEKGELDKRTNSYTLTDEGRALLLEALLDDQSIIEVLGGAPTTASPNTAVSGGDD